jgi:hypothetical protein
MSPRKLWTIAAAAFAASAVLFIASAAIQLSSSAATDPGVALYAAMHARGASMPASWAEVADANHSLICRNYAADYAGWPAGDTDEYGVTVPMAKAAIAASGFCR